MTKTEILRAGLLAKGHRASQSRSARECFTRVGQLADGTPIRWHVWLMTGTLRGYATKRVDDPPRFGDAIAMPKLTARLMEAHAVAKAQARSAYDAPTFF